MHFSIVRFVLSLAAGPTEATYSESLVEMPSCTSSAVACSGVLLGRLKRTTDTAQVPRD